MRVSIDRGDNQSIPNWIGQCSGSSSERNVYSGTALVLKQNQVESGYCAVKWSPICQF